MPIGTIKLKPGINAQATQSDNRDGYSRCNLIRWKDGRPQKLGGWARISDTTISGLARGLHSWADLLGNPYLIVGTEQRVQLYDGGSLYDITPLRATVDIAVQFSTTSGSPTVNIKHVAHGASAGDWINLQTQVAVGGLVVYAYYAIATVVDADNYTITHTSNATANVTNGGAVASFHTNNALPTVDVTLAAHGLAIGNLFVVEIPVTVGGITISGTYSVTSVTNANTFVITHSVVATSTATLSQNGGNAHILYLLSSGLSTATYSVGYGVGGYGSGDYGSGSGTGAVNPLRVWHFDSWGEDAIGNYTGGPFYIWIPPIGTHPRMTLIATAPMMNTASFVAMPQQILVALGTETGGVRDPNLIRWSAVGDYTNFVATATNQAGSFRIPTGARIVGGIQAPQQALIWTDLDLWTMRYIQPPFVFGFTRVAGNCGLISSRAAYTGGTVTYWMTTGGVSKWAGGTVDDVPCPVWDIVFRNLNILQAEKIFAAGNSDFGEVAWFYASATGSGEIDSYFKLNTQEFDAQGNMCWDYGSLVRTAWEDRSVFGPPVGADAAGYLQQHEVSNNADGAAMVGTFIESGYQDLGDGQDVIVIDQLRPDFVRDAGTIMVLTLKSMMVPEDTVKSYGPFSMPIGKKYVNPSPRVRGRQVAFRIGSDNADSFWRFGLIRYRWAPDGRQ